MNIFRTSLLLTTLALPGGFAQGLYIGAEASEALSGDLSKWGAQLGLSFTPSFGVRVAAEGDPSARTLEEGSVDALVYLPVSASTLYFGAGADVFGLGQLGSADDLKDGDLGAHAVGGVEFRLGRFGLFGEVQPVYLVGKDYAGRDAYYLRTRAGLNVHF